MSVCRGSGVFDPLVVLFGQHSSDEADDGSAVGEEPDDIGSAPSLSLEALAGLFGPDLAPDVPGKRGECQQISAGGVVIVGDQIGPPIVTVGLENCGCMGNSWSASEDSAPEQASVRYLFSFEPNASVTWPMSNTRQQRPMPRPAPQHRPTSASPLQEDTMSATVTRRKTGRTGGECFGDFSESVEMVHTAAIEAPCHAG